MSGGDQLRYYAGPCQSLDRNSTTYGNMNEWMKMKGNIVPSHVPVTLTDGNWKEVKDNQPLQRPMSQSARTDELYRRYEQISKNIAYKHPNPGLPRERQGRIGGSWRHIKEVLGHGGSRVVFVDGLVRLYDYDKKVTGSSNLPPLRTNMMTPKYAASRKDVPAYKNMIEHEAEKRSYNPWQTGQYTDGAEKRGKYKGFYSLAKEALLKS